MKARTMFLNYIYVGQMLNWKVYNWKPALKFRSKSHNQHPADNPVDITYTAYTAFVAHLPDAIMAIVQ